jgi:hypothetical protein
LVSNACNDVYEDISWRKRKQFKLAHISYLSLKENRVEPFEKVSLDYVKEHGCVPAFPDYKKGVADLKGFLQALINCT